MSTASGMPAVERRRAYWRANLRLMAWLLAIWFAVSYGCGILAGGNNLMLFRSATMGYFDLADTKKTYNYGGLRLGCWVNAIPAGGIVLVPDASAGCKCSYLNQASLALETAD